MLQAIGLLLQFQGVSAETAAVLAKRALSRNIIILFILAMLLIGFGF
jgi:hypothetical protein